MRLFQIILSGKYKGLNNQSFHFDRTEENIFALIGLNGSGKSQLLELIAEAFAYIERWQRDEFISAKGLGFGVTLHYEWDLRYDTEILSRHDGFFDYSGVVELRVTINLNGSVSVEIWQIDDWVLLGNERSIPIPLVIGYASGLNENLQRSFMKNAALQFEVRRIVSNRQKELSGEIDEKQRSDINKKYVDKYSHIFTAVSGEAFAQGGYLDVNEVAPKVSNLIYIDYDNLGFLLLSLAIIPTETFKELFSGIMFNRLSKAVIRYDLRTGVVAEDVVRDVKMLIRIVAKKDMRPIGKITSNSQYEMYELNYLAGELTLDLMDHNLLEKLREINYGDPLTFFKRLHNIQQLGIKNWSYSTRQDLLKNNFFGAVKKPLKTKLPLSTLKLLLKNDRGCTVSIDDLSDGEAQLMQIISAAFIFSRVQTIFLFDEPETHLNPSWRTFFHSHITQSIALDSETKEKSQFFISTHSPFMISSLKRENVRYFERDNSDLISMKPSFSQTYGASFDVLIKEYYGLRSLISQSVVEDVKKRLPKTNKHCDTADSISWIEKNLGDSMEKAYLLRKLKN